MLQRRLEIVQSFWKPALFFTWAGILRHSIIITYIITTRDSFIRSCENSMRINLPSLALTVCTMQYQLEEVSAGEMALRETLLFVRKNAYLRNVNVIFVDLQAYYGISSHFHIKHLIIELKRLDAAVMETLPQVGSYTYQIT